MLLRTFVDCQKLPSAKRGERLCTQILERLTMLVTTSNSNLAALDQFSDVDVILWLLDTVQSCAASESLVIAVLRLIEALAVHTMSVMHMRRFFRLFQVSCTFCNLHRRVRHLRNTLLHWKSNLIGMSRSTNGYQSFSDLLGARGREKNRSARILWAGRPYIWRATTNFATIADQWLFFLFLV